MSLPKQSSDSVQHLSPTLSPLTIASPSTIAGMSSQDGLFPDPAPVEGGTLAKPAVAQSSTLLNLAAEIKDRIFAYAVAVEDPIVPVQVREKSNKFIWSKDQRSWDPKTYLYVINVGAVPPLAVVALTAVCKQVYQDVALTHLFYRENHFQFFGKGNALTWNDQNGHAQMLNYLVAITEPRRENIRSIEFHLGRTDHKLTVQHLLTMLSGCLGLKVLRLAVERLIISSNPRATRLRRELTEAIKGLSVVSVDIENCSLPTSITQSELNTRTALSNALQSAGARVKPSGAKVREAMLAADLDVYGGSRLIEEKKPGVISSRTRQKVSNEIDADGIICREIPKYDLVGNLVWPVESVRASRQIITDLGDVSVEFQVVCQKHNMRVLWDRYGSLKCEKVELWEELSVLNPNETAYMIAKFYEKEVDSFGKELALKAWKDYRGFQEYGMTAGMSTLAGIIRREAASKGEKASSVAKGTMKRKTKKGKNRDD